MRSTLMGYFVAFGIGLFAAGCGGGGSDTPASGSAPGSPGTPGGSSGAVTSDPSKLSQEIETVGFWTKIGVSFDGSLTFNPTPIVLFRNGEAVYDIEALKEPAGLSAHKAANPSQWTQWRRNGASIQVVKASGWEDLPYTKTMDRLPAGSVLNKTYRSLSGVGYSGVGGSSFVVAWSRLAFDTTGAFSGADGAGSSSDAGGTGVVSTGATNRRGSYRIDGYVLTLNYADGHIEQRMIVTDLSDPKAIWLDGTGYTSS